MLSLRHHGARLCDGISRREMLRAGGLGLMGLSLADLLAAKQVQASAAARPTGGKAKSCIVLFLMGGPPQHSTWDPKPDAPAEVRGEIAPIATKLPGVQFGELMPKLAAMADKLAVLRAVSTGDNAHSSSGYYMMTGRPHAPMNFENANPGPPNDWPNIGSMVGSLTPPPVLPAGYAVSCPRRCACRATSSTPTARSGRGRRRLSRPLARSVALPLRAGFAGIQDSRVLAAGRCAGRTADAAAFAAERAEPEVRGRGRRAAG